ncbi:MAG: choice-of-anchor B family protein [Salinibacter sp.]|uniref:choice-of-anchor B family protein n=1 Tax=Salinibacter sp. TaxID=2065818 RepID=UPI0035D4B6F6
MVYSLHSSVLRVALLCAVGGGLMFGGGVQSALGQQSSITGNKIECEDGTADRYPCKNVDLLSFLSIGDLGGTFETQINDVWGWTDPKTGVEYALVGRTDGIAFVDLSTPTDPVYVGELPTRSEASTWRDVKVYDNHAFVVSEASGHGMQVFDLTQLREATAKGRRPVVFEETAHYGRVESAHNVAVNRETGYAYIVGGNGAGRTCGGGLHVVDVQDPAAPAFAGCFADPSTGRAGTGYTHDAQCTVYEGPDREHRGREVCFNANETALNIADVTDKDSMETIATASYPLVGYVHQAWLTEDQRYLYVDDELDESQGLVSQTRTLVFDVRDLDTPELAASYTGPTGVIDHNQYIEGAYAYQANYQGGLRVLNVAEPERPEEVGYFDTYPGGDAASFEGAWSTYPFFERNMVLISSIGEGLFVVQPSISPILSFTGTRREQGALLRWSVSAQAQTDRIEVEHKPPAARTWRVAETKDGRSSASIREYEFLFEDLRPGTHQFRVRHYSTDGTVQTSGATSVRVLPTEPFVARGPSPNPVQTQSLFRLTLREAQRLRVALYDATGRRVRLLHEGAVEAGVVQRFRIRARQRASGTYFLRVRGESVQLLRKVVVVR